MKIVYWSDFACPYCYIGETRLKKAIAQLEEAGEIKPGSITLEMKAFELEPYAGEHAEGDTLSRFAKKYKLSDEEAAKKIESIEQMGRGEGLEFNYSGARSTNTLDAHRLTKLAQSKGKPVVPGCQIDINAAVGQDSGAGADEVGGKAPAGVKTDPDLADRVIDALFHAYIAEGKELADKSVLLEVAEKCGMDTEEVSAMLDSTDFRGEAVFEEKAAAANGIHVVPTFFIGDYMIPGVIEVKQYKEALRDALKQNAGS